MLTYPEIDPVMLQLGPLKIHWYGFMYLVGFSLAWWLGGQRARQPGAVLTPQQVGDLVFYAALGVVLGGRLGYVIFYDFFNYLTHPLNIFRVWEGGMSFHGGLLGVILVMWWYARQVGRHFFEIADFVAPLVPLGLLAGRIGNFINGELWGRVTDVPWAMVFPRAGDLPRHPSQLYEAALEGVVLFIILYWFSSKPRPIMATSGLFLIGYGVFRFSVEFVREPDRHLGFIAFDWMTMGQLLTIPMLLIGAIFVFWAYRYPITPTPRKEEKAEAS